ncbi:MAG: hypothetical protein FWH34_04805 [Desulfovibrionaceae bacterium]|nr:hypothetical protein [Desulfovibrionaceae bacterium]
MRLFALTLLCVLGCAACARQMTTLSDGQPGYAVSCDTFQERCIHEIALLCRGKHYEVVRERAVEHHLPPRYWSTTDAGFVFPSFNSRYWMEVRCDPSF